MATITTLLTNLIEQARAEHLDAVYNLIVNKEERIPDIAQFTTEPLRKGGVLLMQGTGISQQLLGPSGPAGSGRSFPDPGFLRLSRIGLEQPLSAQWRDRWPGPCATWTGRICASFREPVDPDKDLELSNALPADVALGKVDYYELVGFSDHRSTADIWYRLLNLGFRLPAGAGTDAMANYASLRGPVGMNRVFIAIAGETTPEKLHHGLKQGRTFVSNGPLLGLDIDGRHPGDEITLAKPTTLPYRASLRSIVPVDHFELIFNGRVIADHHLDGTRTQADVSGNVEIPASGWLVLRAWNDHADPNVQDIYPYASTSPVYVTVDRPAAPLAGRTRPILLAWLDRVLANATARNDYNSAQEKHDTLQYLGAARAVFQARTEQSN